MHRTIPEASIARLPVYLRALIEMAEAGSSTVSSGQLATATGVNSAKIRKDLSHLGSYGTRGVGYDLEYLIHQISRELGLTSDWATCIVGVGNLGQALAGYGGFSERGFRIAALFDTDQSLVGRTFSGVEVTHLDECDQVVRRHSISIAVLAVPGRAAQDVADRLVAAGVTSLLNFAPTVLVVPQGISMRKVDLSSELQILAHYEQRRLAERAVRNGSARRALSAVEAAEL